MKKKLAAILMCVSVLGFGFFGSTGQLDKVVQYSAKDPGGS